MFTPIKDRIEYGGAMIGQEEKDAINRVINSQGGKRWTIGPESIAFEKELAEVTGVKRAVVVNSGSSALLVALTGLHLPKKSKVLIPAVNFPTAFNAIIQCGLTPFVVDVDPKTLNISLGEVAKAMFEDDDISAVLAVDIAGNPVDLIELRRIVGDKVKIILDNCDGYGTTYKDKFIDTYADVSCVSFHAAHIITTGEGGGILTDDEELANRCVKIREWGRASGTEKIYDYPGFPDDYRERYVYEEIGYNTKPLELQCAMGRVQLNRLFDFKRKRRSNWSKLNNVFDKYKKFFNTMEYLPESGPCWFSFPFMTTVIPRRVVMETLEKNNIECRTIFSGNILKHPAYKDIEVKTMKINGVADNLKFSDDVMANGVFISVHPSITDEMIQFIDKVLGDLCKSFTGSVE